jgi:hypothetical protein
MKIRKAIKVALTGALFTLPGIAAASLDLSAFTLDASDNITANAFAGMTCSATAGGEAGFLQRQCTDGTNTYIQTIIAEDGSEGLFTDSNVVMTGGNNGIADINVINDSAGSGFTNTTNLQTGALGAANTLGTALNHLGQIVSVDIAQTVDDTSVPNETFSADFGFTKDVNGDSTIAINQSLVNTTSGEEFSQSFDQYERNAAQGGSTDTGVTFAATDYLVRAIINQDVTGVGIFGLQDFADEATGGGEGVDSLVIPATAPYYEITYTDGGNVFP